MPTQIGHRQGASVASALALLLSVTSAALASAGGVSQTLAEVATNGSGSCQGSERLAAAVSGRCVVTCNEEAVISACGGSGRGGGARLCERVDLAVYLDCSRGLLGLNETSALSTDPAFTTFLPAVRVLNLERAHLPHLTFDYFAAFVALQRLCLRDAGVAVVKPDVLAGPGRSLRRLDLSFNRLGRLPVDLLTHNTGLELLDLSNNPAAVVLDNPDLLRPVGARLRVLVIEGLGLTVLPSTFLRHLTGLDALQMARNRLKELDVYSFADLSFASSSVRQGRLTLDFDENEIERVGDYAFASLRLPVTLSLRHNRIRDPGFLMHPTVDSADACRWEASSVNLFDNPLHCGCELYNFTRVKVPGAAITGICAGPKGLRRHLLHGWQYGHSHGAEYFEKSALSLCRDKWHTAAAISASSNASAPASNASLSSEPQLSWRDFAAQFSCRCGRWFDPAREFLREENCVSVRRTEVHAHDRHGGQDHEHEEGADADDQRDSRALPASSSSFADLIRDRSGAIGLGAAATSAQLLLFSLLLPPVLTQPV